MTLEPAFIYVTIALLAFATYFISRPSMKDTNTAMLRQLVSQSKKIQEQDDRIHALELERDACNYQLSFVQSQLAFFSSRVAQQIDIDFTVDFNWQAELRRLIKRYLDETAVETIAFDLEINDLDDRNFETITRDLLKKANAQNKIPALMSWLERERPDIVWTDTVEENENRQKE